MKTINANTIKGQSLINSYNRATASRLCEVYSTYSTAKARAEMWCINRMSETGGHGFRIMSANTMQFTCGWIREDGNLQVETAANTYVVTL